MKQGNGFLKKNIYILLPTVHYQILFALAFFLSSQATLQINYCLGIRF